MSDIMEGAKSKGSVSGLRTPKQYSTIAGPGVRTNNQYNVEKQSKLSINGKKNK